MKCLPSECMNGENEIERYCERGVKREMKPILEPSICEIFVICFPSSKEERIIPLDLSS